MLILKETKNILSLKERKLVVVQMLQTLEKRTFSRHDFIVLLLNQQCGFPNDNREKIEISCLSKAVIRGRITH